MRSTFHGLETLKRAIYAQQYALYTTGHNIANANTPGYSRQRVNFGTMYPLDPLGANRSAMPGQLGTGVIVREVVRLRESFLDGQFRKEYQRFGEWEVRLDTLEKLEAITNEPSESGLGAIIDEFWAAWHTLSNGPGENTNRTVVIEKMKTLAEALNTKGRQLNDLKEDLSENLDIKYTEANERLKQIADLNGHIAEIEATGDNANDLRDRRDLLVDELSKLADIRVETTVGSNGQEVYTIVLANDSNTPPDNVLVSGTAVNELEQGEQIVAGGEINGLNEALKQVEKYKAELDTMVNTLVNGPVEVTLPEGTILTKDVTVNGTTYPAGTRLTEPLTLKVNGVNGLHELGWNGKEPPQPGGPLFVSADGGPLTAENIRVSDALLEDETLLAPSNRNDADGSNGIALIMGKLGKDGKFEFGSGNATISEGTIGNYYSALTAKLGVETDSAKKQLDNLLSSLNHIDMRRASVSAVSLDEEMANLIQFQHAYNAAARNMTAIDEMLDRIINGMGHVGR